MPNVMLFGGDIGYVRRAFLSMNRGQGKSDCSERNCAGCRVVEKADHSCQQDRTEDGQTNHRDVDGIQPARWYEGDRQNADGNRQYQTSSRAPTDGRAQADARGSVVRRVRPGRR